MSATSEITDNSCPICRKSGVNFNVDSTCPQCESDLSIYSMLDQAQAPAPAFPSVLKLKHDYSNIPKWKIFFLALLFILLLFAIQGFGLHLFFNKLSSSQADLGNRQQEFLTLKKDLEIIKKDNAGPKSLFHIFAAEETLWEVAKRYWGDGALYPVLLEYNPHLNLYRTTVDTTIFVDLRLPVIKKLADKIILIEKRRRFMNYLVRPGDTLRKIAIRFYGKKRISSFLAKLKKVRRLKVGERIVVPLPH